MPYHNGYYTRRTPCPPRVTIRVTELNRSAFRPRGSCRLDNTIRLRRLIETEQVLNQSLEASLKVQVHGSDNPQTVDKLTELKNKIYELCHPSTTKPRTSAPGYERRHGCIETAFRGGPPRLNIARLHTSRRVYDEARLLVYRFNSFVVDGRAVLDFATSIGMDASTRIRNVRLLGHVSSKSDDRSFRDGCRYLATSMPDIRYLRIYMTIGGMQFWNMPDPNPSRLLYRSKASHQMRQMRQAKKMHEWSWVKGVRGLDELRGLSDIEVEFRVAGPHKTLVVTDELDLLENQIKQRLVPSLYSEVYQEGQEAV